MKTILFVCTHNSARSQMAEGLVNNYFGGMQGFSAGTEKTRVNPFAITVMQELDIDMSDQFSKTTEYFGNQSFDYVVTVCDHARETCPYYPNADQLLHQSFEDPSAATGSDDHKLQKFREVRIR